jgi:hypothetical protein
MKRDRHIITSSGKQKQKPPMQAVPLYSDPGPLARPHHSVVGGLTLFSFFFFFLILRSLEVFNEFLRVSHADMASTLDALLSRLDRGNRRFLYLVVPLHGACMRSN